MMASINLPVVVPVSRACVPDIAEADFLCFEPLSLFTDLRCA
jgi:hypothetical protein